MMDLRCFARALEEHGLLVTAPPDVPEVRGVTDDSRRVGPGSLFCAIEGTEADGHTFLEDAARRGAAAAVVSDSRPVPIPQLVVRDSRRAAGVVAAEWYGRPGLALSLIGVTGTNGKTTTVTLIRHLLNDRGCVGSIGTLGAFDGDGNRLEGFGVLTTPGPIEFHAALAALRERGVETVVMEASSHGLDQGRLDAVRFRAGVYTNLTHEHLDYHGDLQSYARAKMRLSELISAGGVEVVNADDDTWAQLPVRESLRRVRYGRAPTADLSLIGEELSATGSRAVMRVGGLQVTSMLPLLGEFNVTNALAAVCTAWQLGCDPAALARRLQDAPQVPGRMEVLAQRSFTVIRDYAHTPDGFERSIRTIRAITPGKLYVLFGAGGDRDRAKRPIMGHIAEEGADRVILALDNPRTEDPERIFEDIESGMLLGKHARIDDREKAIRDTVSGLRAGDCLLLLGKGHETYQIIGHEKFPFDERAIVQAAVGDMA